MQISPVDARVMHFGEAHEGIIEQVKGITYTQDSFTGPALFPPQPVESPPIASISSSKTWGNLFGLLGLRLPSSLTAKRKEQPVLPPESRWYHCVLYLAPGDYHRIHSPADWTIQKARHFPGYLFPVHPRAMKFIRGLLAVNERVVLAGHWKHGKFTMAAVGAYNVGSIKIEFDHDIVTNKDSQNHMVPSYPPPALGGPFFERVYGPGVACDRGQEVGGFQLGSTVVLLFQAPPNFHFELSPGEKVRVGQRIGALS
mmetsp:Transcript_38533/g.63993  ORF Transcript_38533/g.63993 Transcript_38533/m.63993 type:complete len:256 (-) Transcript_38533:1550-2317(-)